MLYCFLKVIIGGDGMSDADTEVTPFRKRIDHKDEGEEGSNTLHEPGHPIKVGSKVVNPFDDKQAYEAAQWQGGAAAPETDSPGVSAVNRTSRLELGNRIISDEFGDNERIDYLHDDLDGRFGSDVAHEIDDFVKYAVEQYGVDEEDVRDRGIDALTALLPEMPEDDRSQEWRDEETRRRGVKGDIESLFQAWKERKPGDEGDYSAPGFPVQGNKEEIQQMAEEHNRVEETKAQNEFEEYLTNGGRVELGDTETEHEMERGHVKDWLEIFKVQGAKVEVVMRDDKFAGLAVKSDDEKQEKLMSPFELRQYLGFSLQQGEDGRVTMVMMDDEGLPTKKATFGSVNKWISGALDNATLMGKGLKGIVSLRDKKQPAKPTELEEVEERDQLAAK